ncbi:hypothetical protein EVA_18525 [gut metagenome]|uniref:Uncharacterized protein n=1 Tax=gut metagenome TaxID=749906 RepID=J9FEM8_9ZZZZ
MKTVKLCLRIGSGAEFSGGFTFYLLSVNSVAYPCLLFLLSFIQKYIRNTGG